METLRVGDNISITKSKAKPKFYRIVGRDKFFYEDAHSSLAAASEDSAYTKITNLDPPAEQLYYIYGIGMVGNVRLYLKQPAAVQRWGTELSPEGSFLDDRISPRNAPEPIELWLTHDIPPFVKKVNFTRSAIVATITWFGWKFLLDELTKEEQAEVERTGRYEKIIIGGFVR